MLWSTSVYRKPGKQPSDTISFQNNFITSSVFGGGGGLVVFFVYLAQGLSEFVTLFPWAYLREGLSAGGGLICG